MRPGDDDHAGASPSRGRRVTDAATGYQEKLGRIIDLLEQRVPRGLSVSEIARTLGMNRVSTAKYLDVLATGGDVRVERFGRSKLYHPSDRLPLTELFESLPNAIVILDADLQVRMVNASFMTTLDIRQGRNLVGTPIFDLDLPVFSEPAVGRNIERIRRSETYLDEMRLIDDKTDPVTEMDDEMWHRVFSVNVDGQMRMFRAAIPEMLKNPGDAAGLGKGAFVNVVSIAGTFGGRGGPAYTASKHGVIGLAKNVAFMYAKKGIRSNMIAPGGVNTDMAAGVAGWDQEGIAICQAGVADENPRCGEPEEIARVALFRASDESSLVNGAVVTADAGWLAH